MYLIKTSEKQTKEEFFNPIVKHIWTYLLNTVINSNYSKIVLFKYIFLEVRNILGEIKHPF